MTREQLEQELGVVTLEIDRINREMVRMDKRREDLRLRLRELAAELLIQGSQVKPIFFFKGKIKDLSAAIREAQEKSN